MSKRRDKATQKGPSRTSPDDSQVSGPRTTAAPQKPVISKRFVVVVAAVAILALVVLAIFWSGYLTPSSSSSSPTFIMDGTSENFTGNASSAFEVIQSNSCTGFVCGSAPVGGSIAVLDEISPSTYNCKDLDQYEVSRVTASASGAFVLTSVRAFASVTGVQAPLPAFTPWENQTTCVGVVGLFITVRVVDQGPASQLLYLTDEVEEAH